MTRHAGRWAALATLFAATASAQEPNGVEFLVNAYTTAAQRRPSIARDASGHFVVAWVSPSAVDTPLGIMARRFNSAGVPLGSDFQVNSYTTGFQDYPRVAAAPDGRFVVVWEGPDSSSTGIFGQRYDATGAPVGGEFQANTNTTGLRYFSSVAMDGSGNFVVAWSDSALDGSSTGIFARRFDAGLDAFGAPFLVNGYTTGGQTDASVGMAPDGAFVVAWGGQGPGDGSGVFVRRFDAAGNPLGGESLANVVTAASQFFPSVAMAPDQSFVVVWQSSVGAGDTDIFGRRYDAAGTPIGGQFQVNTSITSYQVVPDVAIDSHGAFMVTWWNYPLGGDGSAQSVDARRFDSTGTPLGPDFRVNTYTTGLQYSSTVAAGPEGQFIVAWGSVQDGNSQGVFAQRYGDLIFADGFDSAGLGMWSTSSTGGGDLSASAAAAIESPGFGLQAVVNDTAGLFVQDDAPSAETHYRARFTFDPNGFDPGISQSHLRTRVLIGFVAPSRRVFAIVLRRQAGGQYSLLGRVRRDDNTQADTGFFPITDAPHAVEIEFVRSSGPDALDGTFQLWIDGVSVATLTGLDNSASAVDFARMGMMNVKDGAAGTVFFDDFQSRRRTAIGPVP